MTRKKSREDLFYKGCEILWLMRRQERWQIHSEVRGSIHPSDARWWDDEHREKTKHRWERWWWRNRSRLKLKTPETLEAVALDVDAHACAFELESMRRVVELCQRTKDKEIEQAINIELKSVTIEWRLSRVSITPNRRRAILNEVRRMMATISDDEIMTRFRTKVTPLVGEGKPPLRLPPRHK